MTLKAAVILPVLLGGASVIAVPTPLSAQQTPRERAESLERMANAAETPDEDRPRLWLLALAEWYEDGARAVLAGDRDRLEYASAKETVALWQAYMGLGRICPDVPIPAASWRVTSYLAYALGHWDGQRGMPASASKLANDILETADQYRMIGDLARRFC